MGQRSTSRAETWTKCYPGLNHAPVGHFIFGFCKFVATALAMFVGHWMFWQGESAGIMPVRGNHGGFLIYSTTPLRDKRFSTSSTCRVVVSTVSGLRLMESMPISTRYSAISG